VLIGLEVAITLHEKGAAFGRAVSPHTGHGWSPALVRSCFMAFEFCAFEPG
jgi:hypothetical protein